jgi:hypothetical protein
MEKKEGLRESARKRLKPGFGFLRNTFSKMGYRGKMDLLKLVSVQCPYCGESIDIMVDCTVENQEFIEDCQVCCKPITFSVTVLDRETPHVDARTEDDS